MSVFVSNTLRAVGVYFVLLVIARLMGKREVSHLTIFDYIVGITIGSIAGIMAVDASIPWSDVLPGVLVFGTLQIVTSFVSMKSPVFRRIINGTPTVLIKDGNIIEKNLVKEKLSAGVLISRIREKNAFSLADVEFAVMEPDGEISVMLKPGKQPLTPDELKIETVYKGLPQIVIENGNILGKRLKDMGLTVSWLMDKLSERGIFDVAHISLAQADNSGNLYIDLNDEYGCAPRENSYNEILFSRLQKLHSDFSAFATETANRDAQNFYRECEQSTKSIMEQLRNYFDKKH